MLVVDTVVAVVVEVNIVRAVSFKLFQVPLSIAVVVNVVWFPGGVVLLFLFITRVYRGDRGVKILIFYCGCVPSRNKPFDSRNQTFFLGSFMVLDIIFFF